ADSSSISNIEIATDVGTLAVTKEAWDSIADNAGDSAVTLSISQVQTAEGNNPLAYELTAKADGEDVFAQGSTGTITVDVPAPSGMTEAYVYYLGPDGAEQVGAPSVSGNRISWDVTHFSTYVVTQNENRKAFTVTGD